MQDTDYTPTAATAAFEEACRARSIAEQIHNELSAVTRLNFTYFTTANARDRDRACRRALRLCRRLTAALEAATRS